MIESSVTDLNWLEKVPKNRPGFIIADGLMEYLTEEEVKMLLNHVTNYFPSGQIAFDIMNSYALKMGRSRLQKTTGAEHKWAVDDVRKVDELNPRLKRIANLTLLESKYLPLKYRILFGPAFIVPRYRNMIRLLRYEF